MITPHVAVAVQTTVIVLLQGGCFSVHAGCGIVQVSIVFRPRPASAGQLVSVEGSRSVYGALAD